MIDHVDIRDLILSVMAGPPFETPHPPHPEEARP